ncbi:MAG: Crp/Fnr family transcriptional regulator [Crocinitomicaceae bacterium]|nr:Crp/Fnr family transcriptional regulator [Crocinitomicaceae bacterium]MBT6030229.1 Crp/Fnr family transcriptional regulator [Crocinitomicaceae bacterium]
MIQTLNRIFELDAFKELNPEEIDWLQEKSKLKSFEKGEFIFSPGNPSASVLFVVEGRVKLGAFNNDGKEMIKHIFFQNELFGIMAISNQKLRANYSKAMDDYNEVLEIDVYDMKKLMQKNASFSLGISKIMGDRLVQFQERIESLMFKDTSTRVIDLLKEFAKKQGQQVGDEIMIKHNLTHQDFASLTATTRQTVTSILNDLKKEDLIYMERGKMLIRNIDKLSYLRRM